MITNTLKALLLCVILSPLQTLSCPSVCTKNPRTILEETTEKINADILAFKKKNAQNDDQINHSISKTSEEILIPLIDIKSMVMHVIGRYHWKMSSKNEQKRFHRIFQQVVLREYTQFLVKTSHTKIKFASSRTPNNTEYQTIAAKAYIEEKPNDLIFYMKCSCDDAKQWKITDITVDNVSYLDQYHLKYAATIRNKGLKGLNNKLEDSLKESI